MNLASCENCGVLIDKDMLNFPTDEEIWGEDGSADDTKCTWIHDDCVASLPCPVCKEPIPETDRS